MKHVETAGLKERMIRAGRAMLALDLQNTHSGNLSVRVGSRMLITRSGSMKGHLRPKDILDVGLEARDDDPPGASVESGSHRRILQYARAVVHAHSISATLMSFVSRSLVPVDFLGSRWLGEVPVCAFTDPVGSRDMEDRIPQVLRDHVSMVVEGHGPFVRGETLEEALSRLSTLDVSSRILWWARRLRMTGGVPPGLDRWPDPCAPATGRDPGNGHTDRRWRRVSRIIFEMGLSPFFTGSMSLWTGEGIQFTPCASCPEDFPILSRRLPPGGEEADGFHAWLSREIQTRRRTGAVIICHPAAVVLQGLVCRFRRRDHLKPIDAEGCHLYPRVPLVPAGATVNLVMDALKVCPVVLLEGVGAVAAADDEITALRHLSSLNNICRIKTEMDLETARGNVRKKPDLS